MVNYNNIISLFIISVLFYIVGFMGFNTMSVLAQDQSYTESVDNETVIPDYQESDSYQEFSENEDQNPDPEFMEEVEPGEYDQSDDTTELNEDYYY